MAAGNNIKGITIEIGGNTTGLDKALKGVNSTINTTQNELKEINKALKLDPKNTELLAQKQRALAKAVEATSEKVKMLKEAQKQAAEQLAKGDIGQEQYDALTRELVKAEAASKKATKALAEFDVGISKAQASLSKISTAAESVADKTQKLSAVAAGVVTGIAALGVKAAQTADDLNTLSQQTGLSTDELQKFQYASELVDVSVESITGAMAKMTRNMASGSAETTEAWNRLGVSVRGADGQMRSTSEVFYSTLEALSRVGNETERDQLAMQLFGRSANELAGIIDDGGAALKAYGEEAENLGLIMDQETLDALNQVNDQIDRLKAQAAAEMIKAGATAVEALTPLLEDLIETVSKLLSTVGSMDAASLKLILTLAAVVAAIFPVASGIAAVSNAANVLIGLLPKIASFFGTTNPQAAALVAILVLMAGLIGQIVGAWGDMSGWEKAISVIGALVIAATAAAIALGAVNSAATMGAAAAAIVAGILMITAAVNSATKSSNSASGIVNGITSHPTGGGGGGTYNNYATNNYTTTNNYGGTPQAIQVNIDGKQAALALYDPLQDVGYQHGPQYTR